MKITLPPVLTRRLRRPFDNAHWSLLVLFVGSWPLWLWGAPCREEPYYFEAVWGTVLVCASLWLNHLRVAPVTQWKNIAALMGGAIYDLSLLLVLWLLMSIPVAIMMPTSECQAPRHKVAELFVMAAPVRAEIVQRAVQRQTIAGVGAGLSIPVSGRLKKGLVTENGTIIMASDDPPAVVVLEPNLGNQELSWKCSGYPAKYMPVICRDGEYP